MRSGRIEQVDSLRALAIGCVLVMHVGHYSGFNATPLGRFTAHLNVGVPVFFVLSGFVLYRPFVSALLASAQPPSLARYAVRRALRLLPAYWVAFGVLAVWPGLVGLRRSGPWPYLTLVQSFSSDWYFGGIPAAWSLSVELAFSALLPVFAWLSMQLGALPSSAARVRAASALCAALGVLGLACLGLGRASGSWIADALPGHLFYFALGMWLAVRSSVPPSSTPPASSTFGTAAWGAACALYLVHCAVFPIGDLRAPPSPLQAVAAELSFGAIAWLLTLPAVFGARDGSRLQSLLRAPACVTLGAWSYGMFLWHQPPLAWLSIHTAAWGAGTSFVVCLCALLPFAVLMGWLSQRFVERPSMRLADRLLTSSASAEQRA